jgi:hypothetical protein
MECYGSVWLKIRVAEQFFDEKLSCKIETSSLFMGFIHGKTNLLSYVNWAL